MNGATRSEGRQAHSPSSCASHAAGPLTQPEFDTHRWSFVQVPGCADHSVCSSMRLDIHVYGAQLGITCRERWSDSCNWEDTEMVCLPMMQDVVHM